MKVEYIHPIMIGTPEATQQTLMRIFHLSAEDAGNLDAIHDCLTEFNEPVTLAFTREALLIMDRDEFCVGLLDVLTDIVNENPKIEMFMD